MNVTWENQPWGRSLQTRCFRSRAELRAARIREAKGANSRAHRSTDHFDFENNSPSGYISLFAVSDNAAAVPLFAENTATGQYCYVDANGNLNCSGSKNAVVPIDGQRRVALSAIESPKNWFEDFGSAQLSAGVVTVALEPKFAQP